MQQKRLRRKARRDQRAPYQWLPNRKAGRSNSNSSMSSEGSLDLDFDDSVWKPDVKADLKSEFVMAWSIWTQMPGDAFKDVDLPRDIFWGEGFAGGDTELCQSLVQRGNQSWPCDCWRVTWKNKRLPADLNPSVIHGRPREEQQQSNRTFFWCLDLDGQQPDLIQTFYGMITETYVNLSIPEFSGWWWYFQTFLYKFFF